MMEKDLIKVLFKKFRGILLDDYVKFEPLFAIGMIV